MADEPVVVEPEVTPEVTPEIKPLDRNELLREMSKEYGVNLFDAEGIKKFKEYQESQKTDLQKAQEALKGYQEKETQWQTEKLKYEAKLKASELGIHPDNLDDALKLAEGDPAKLVEVVKKYPFFKSKEGVQIGVTPPGNTPPPSTRTEVEAYMAANPRIYGGGKK